MVGKKRGRDEGEEDGEVSKRGREEESGVQGSSPDRRPSSRASDKTGGNGTVCPNGHECVLVPREVRKLEKDNLWSCDSGICKNSWDHSEGNHMDRQRYRCFQYLSGGKCNFDLCGDCFTIIKDCVDSRDSRRSSREIKPKYNSRDGEWLISPKFQAKRSPEKHSPREVITSPKRASRRSRHGSESPTPRASATVGRSTRSRRSSLSPTPRTAAGRSPRAAAKTAPPETETESEPEDNAQSPAFYPSNHHVRFSPSVKTASPFGRKTRSGRRALSSSFLQTLGSEDEQSAFNRQYSRDLRKRQARKLSEEGADEEPRTRRGKPKRIDTAAQSEEEPGRRSGRGRGVIGPEDYEDEEEEPAQRRSSRRRVVSESQSEPEAPLERPRRGRQARPVSESEEDQPLASRRRPARGRKKDETEDEDEADPTVTEASVRR